MADGERAPGLEGEHPAGDATPSVPAEPADPSVPAEPADPSASAEPAEPVRPEDAAEPAGPEDALASTGPERLADSVSLVDRAASGADLPAERRGRDLRAWAGRFLVPAVGVAALAAALLSIASYLGGGGDGPRPPATSASPRPTAPDGVPAPRGGVPEPSAAAAPGDGGMPARSAALAPAVGGPVEARDPHSGLRTDERLGPRSGRARRADHAGAAATRAETVGADADRAEAARASAP
ncbi:hypothetical protein [Streptomyces fradiae]|uniref:hypothetical protein n=1 Tax=Streptomyces fradiae TaxID=1906 RepID=UPI0035BE5DD1